MKISVVVARHNISGVPLAQARLARALAAAGHEVTLLYGVADGPCPQPPPGVTLRLLGKVKVRDLLWPLFRHLRRDQPDLVFVAEDHLNVIVLLAALIARAPTRISASSRVTPFDTYSSRIGSKRWLLKQLSRLTFARADVLSCVSRDMVGQYRQLFGAEAPHQPIYNIIDDAPNRARLAEPVEHAWLQGHGPPVVAAAGSLQPWKGFDDLISAVARLRDQGRDLRLLIMGDGPQRNELEQLIARLNMSDRVQLAGHVENVLAVFARAQLFVLSSRVEGLPNVLVEAMMAGCPVVATDCPTGPREVLDGGRFGPLVPVGDVPALAAAIAATLDRPTDPALLAEAVRPFTAEEVLASHFQALGLA